MQLRVRAGQLHEVDLKRGQYESPTRIANGPGAGRVRETQMQGLRCYYVRRMTSRFDLVRETGNIHCSFSDRVRGRKDRESALY